MQRYATGFISSPAVVLKGPSVDGRALIASLTLFRRDTRNQIDFDNSTFTYGNIDRTRAKGAEVAIALRPVDAFAVTASYSYLDARDRSPGATFGNRLARRASKAVSVSADYDWSFGLSTGATLTHVGDSFDDPANTRRLDGYVLAGHIHPGVRLHGAGKQSVRLPCFWFGARTAVLPAFGEFTGLASVDVQPGDHVWVIADDEIVDVSAR